MTASDDNTLTADDIGDLNRQAVARAAAFARLAGTALIIAGAIGFLAWLWLAGRTQRDVETSSTIDPFGGETEAAIEFGERLDLLASGVSVGVIAVLTAGVGLGLRLVADYTVARTGGSLTGFEPGDEV